jgi:hypothetical protein
MYILYILYPSGIRCHLLALHSTKSVKQSAAPPITTDVGGLWCMFCDEVDLGIVFDLFSAVFHWLLYHLSSTFVNSVQGRT